MHQAGEVMIDRQIAARDQELTEMSQKLLRRLDELASTASKHGDDGVNTNEGSSPPTQIVSLRDSHERLQVDHETSDFLQRSAGRASRRSPQNVASAEQPVGHPALSKREVVSRGGDTNDQARPRQADSSSPPPPSTVPLDVYFEQSMTNPALLLLLSGLWAVVGFTVNPYDAGDDAQVAASIGKRAAFFRARIMPPQRASHEVAPTALTAAPCRLRRACVCV